MNYYKFILKDTEKRVAKSMKFQIMDKNNKNYGAIDDMVPYPEQKPTAKQVGTAVCVYVNVDSKFYLSEEVYNFILLGLNYIKKKQREDGTFDLEDCNFNAAPDTGFLIMPLIEGYKLLNKFEDTNNKNVLVLKDLLYDIIYNAIEGMSTGGFHTPNHRWAIASVMATCLEFIKNDKLNSYIKSYLIEGIDCNEDGEYTERSAAGYNIVNNEAMILLYDSLGDKECLNSVTKNLTMMLNYIEPDGVIFSDNSTRQDKGTKVYPSEYFYEYLYIASLTGNKDFENAANAIVQHLYETRVALAPDCLGKLMLKPQLIDYKFSGCGFPKEYNKYYKGSGLARIKKGNYSCSVIKNSTKVLTFQSGATPVYLKIGAYYFNNRNFKAEQIIENNGVYTLTWEQDGWYYLPFKEKPSTSDWEAMDNSKREKVIKNKLKCTATVTPNENGIDFNIRSEGCDRVKLTFEIGIPATCEIETDYFFKKAEPGSAIVAKEGMITIKNGDDILTIGPAFCEHKFIDGKFGSEERGLFNQTIYFTAETNFDKTIHFITK